MSCFKNFLRNFVLRSDMFAASPTMRYNGQSAYESLCGGFLSIFLVIGFMVIFATSFIDVLTKVNITASTQLQDNVYHTTPITDMVFAVGIEGLNFADNQKHFSLLVNKVKRNESTLTTTAIELQICNISNWKDLGTEFEELFTVYNIGDMLCPVAGQNLSLQGFQGTEYQEYIGFQVQQCLNTSTWTCYPQNETDSFMLNHFLTNDFFKAQLFIVDTILSPHSEDYLDTVIETQIFQTFGKITGTRGHVKMGHYTITTDSSIWPVTDQAAQTGNYIDQFSTHTIELLSTHYVHTYLQKSRKVQTIARAHQKLDNMLSYVGGLFALLFGWLYFFIGSYNQYSYEISVAQSSFAMDQSGRKIKSKNFGFFTYLQYALFDWMKAFSIKMQWKKIQEFDKAREEVIEQMDMKLLIKRVQRFERMIEFLLQEHNLVCANLLRPPTLENIKMLRKITQYYDKVVHAQMQENLIENILNITDKQNQKGNKVGDQNVLYDSDFDSDDEEAQKKIIENFQKNQKCDDKMAKKIMEKIPSHMKQRLSQINGRSRNKGNIEIGNFGEIESQTSSELKRGEVPSKNNSKILVFNLQ